MYYLRILINKGDEANLESNPMVSLYMFLPVISFIDYEGPLFQNVNRPFALDDRFRGKENGRTKTCREDCYWPSIGSAADKKHLFNRDLLDTLDGVDMVA
jgi:hypothetical protein